MTDEAPKPDLPFAALNKRASSAASALHQQTTALATPDLRSVALARRAVAGAACGGLAVLVVAIVVVSVFAGGALPWVVGALLGLATVGVIGLGIHAGGHGWFVPLPVIVLAGAWALTAAAGTSATPAAWVLACLTLMGALGGAALVAPAIAYRHSLPPPRGPEALVGADGVALSPLAPTGVVRVMSETWTAESLSGPLPAGAVVHVVKVEGLHLLVWSETGTVLGPDALGPTSQESEER
jgi:membrane protein implicated in regulation of membrane protease activity